MTPQQKALQDCAKTLHDIAHGLESSRIWNGMGWTYNPLHSFKYLPLVEKARESATQAKQALEPQAQGEAKADCLCGRYEFCPDCEPGLFGEVQPTITSSESRSPIAHLRARTSQHKWNSYELCQADDPNGIAVYAHPQASEPALKDDPLQGAVDWLLQADGEFFCVATVQRTLRIGYNRAKRLADIARERTAAPEAK